MAINKYFDNLNNQNEQDLMMDLIQESIRIYASDVLVIIRDMENFDELLREEKLSVFRTTYTIEAFVESNRSDTMQRYMSKFGFRFEETNEIIISAKSWDELGTGFNQPPEGSYVYIGDPEDYYGSFTNCMFQINQVLDSPIQMGGITLAYKLMLSNVNKSYSNVLDTNYTDINDFLNPTTEKENKTTIKKIADDFTDVNVVANGNPFTKWGTK